MRTGAERDETGAEGSGSTDTSGIDLLLVSGRNGFNFKLN